MIYYDYTAIQNDARQKVLDLQKKTLERDGVGHHNNSNEQNNSRGQSSPHGQSNAHTQNNNPRGQNDARGHHGSQHSEGHAKKKHQEKKLHEKIFAEKEIDMEALLLIGLAALLVSEGADMSLIAALLYII